MLDTNNIPVSMTNSMSAYFFLFLSPPPAALFGRVTLSIYFAKIGHKQSQTYVRASRISKSQLHPKLYACYCVMSLELGLKQGLIRHKLWFIQTVADLQGICRLSGCLQTVKSIENWHDSCILLRIPQSVSMSDSYRYAFYHPPLRIEISSEKNRKHHDHKNAFQSKDHSKKLRDQRRKICRQKY